MLTDFALLVLRSIVGGVVAAHGAQKLFGWFGGYGLVATSGYMGDQLRLRPAIFWTALAGLSEFGGGLLLGVGFLSPLGSLGIIASMVTATVLVHWWRFWASDNGFEYPLVLLTAAAVIAISGPGVYSLDAAVGISLPAPATFVAGLVAVAAGVATALMTRAPTAPAVIAETETSWSQAA